MSKNKNKLSIADIEKIIEYDRKSIQSKKRQETIASNCKSEEEQLNDLLKIARKNNNKLDSTRINQAFKNNASNDEDLFNKAIDFLLNNGVILDDNSDEENKIAKVKTGNNNEKLDSNDKYSGLLTADQEKTLGKLMKEGNEQERNDAKEKFINANSGLVRHVIKKEFSRYKGIIDPEDLFSYGLIGLIKATECFDYKKGFRFSTYAYPFIKRYLQRECYDNEALIRVPVYVREASNKINAAINELTQSLKREPTCEEISEKLNDAEYPPKKVAEILTSTKRAVSIDEPVTDDDDLCKADIIIDTTEKSINNVIDNEISNAMIEQVFEQLLNDEEKIILGKCLGIYDYSKEKLVDIAKQFHTSVDVITRIRDNALAKLRRDGRIKKIAEKN